MSLSVEKLYIRHWVRFCADLVNEYFNYVPIDKQNIRMYFVKIYNSIHYTTIMSNNYSIYNQYIETSGQPEHSELKFKSLISNWDINKMDKINLTIDEDLMTVTDGVHRICVYLYKNNMKSVPIKYLNIEYPENICKTIESALIKTTSDSHYNGWSNSRTKYGYHSFNLFNINLTGQRNPKERLDIMRKHYSFDDKYIIDIGCNTGGMLFHCTEIKKGRGVDFDQKCIGAANTIKGCMCIFDHVNFIQRDLDKENGDIIFSDGRADVVFLLSIGSWIKKWRELYTLVINNTDTIFLETNNKDEGVAQIKLFEDAGCKIEMISAESKDDITNNHGRATYLITTGIKLNS